MSGCHPDQRQELSSCVHGIVDFCAKCNKIVWDKIREFTTRIEALHCNKISQIDLNKKAEKKFEELEKYIDRIDTKTGFSISHLADGIRNLEKSRDAHSSNHKNIFERIEKLESENKMRQDTIVCMDSAYNDALLDFEKRLNELEKQLKKVMRFQDILHEQYKANMRTFKCPFCEGKGSWGLGSIEEMLNNNGCSKMKCKSCEGRGIIWG